MPSICFYFQVHQPKRVKKYRVFDIGQDHNYFNDSSETSLNNKKVLEKVKTKSYLPTNALLLKLIKKYPEFKVSFSLSGVFLEQLIKDFPEVLESFQKLVEAGKAGHPEFSRVEILDETYYHSLAFLYSRDEFKKQVGMHRDLVKQLFGVEPQIFRNTELIYHNDLAWELEQMGYKGVLAEGADHVLGWRSPNFLYSTPGTQNIKLLLKNYKLSDDIAFRFSDKGWKEWPLNVEKYGQWINSVNGNGEVVNLFMDYETFGEHQWEDTGIFNFLEALPNEILKHPDNGFVTPSESISKYSSKGVLDVPFYVSWADVERDLSAWRSNSIQEDALRTVYGLENEVLDSKDDAIINDWRALQTSDHFYYMCTKWFNDGDVHKYFNPYDTPYEAFIAYMNALHDLKLRIKEKKVKKKSVAKVSRNASSLTT